MPLLMCPNDNASMQTVNRDGVEFDMCPACRGVWLDRGELEKLMEAARAAYAAGPPQQAPAKGQAPGQADRSYGERGEYGEHGDDHTPGRKRRGFDLFDIFD